MDLQLGGKRALVTGSTAGIGHAIASLLASEGAAVTVNGRTKARVDDAVRSIRQLAPRATVSGRRSVFYLSRTRSARLGNIGRKARVN